MSCTFLLLLLFLYNVQFFVHPFSCVLYEQWFHAFIAYLCCWHIVTYKWQSRKKIITNVCLRKSISVSFDSMKDCAVVVIVQMNIIHRKCIILCYAMDLPGRKWKRWETYCNVFIFVKVFCCMDAKWGWWVWKCEREMHFPDFPTCTTHNKSIFYFHASHDYVLVWIDVVQCSTKTYK